MEKEALRGFSHDPKYVAEQIRDVIDIMIGRMSPEGQQSAYPNLRAKIKELSVHEMNQKKQTGGAAIGVSIGLIKNILNGKDPYFIKAVLDELGRSL